MKKLLVLYSLSCLFLACSNNKLSKFDFLIGTWKIEGKERYEVWEKIENNELIGHAYEFNNNQKTITETLILKIENDQIIFEATVPSQNEGKPIQFILNKSIAKYFSFENEQHDFPKKIQYKRITDSKIEISVLGSDNEGFSFIQKKL